MRTMRLISRPLPERLTLAILGFFMMMAPASIDMYLPALSFVARDLHTSMARVQLSISWFLFGFGLGQLLWGPLSDRFGRRAPLLAGLVLFIGASLACAQAHSINQLMIARFVQALGACAMPVIAQAIARDVWGKRSAHALSIMVLVMSIAPLVAPIVGAQILRVTILPLASWRIVFALLTATGVIALAWLAILPETRPAQARGDIRAKTIALNYLHLLRDRRYLGYVLTGAAIWGAMFAYVTGTPFVYIVYFHLSPQTFSFLFAANVFGMMAITFLNTKLLRTHSSDALLRVGLTGGALCALLLVLAWYTGWLTLGTTIVLLLVFMSLRGFVSANAVAGALAHHPERAGAAAAFAGFLQFTGGSVGGKAVSVLGNGTPLPMLIVVATFSVIALGLQWAFIRPARATSSSQH